MRIRAWLWCSLLSICSVPLPALAQPAAAAVSCSNEAAAREVSSGLDLPHTSCPVPAAADLVTADDARALAVHAGDAAAQRRKLAAMHTLANWARTEPAWGPGFAARIEALLDHLDPSACREQWPIAFTKLQTPTAPVNACKCAFEAGSAGDPGHACFRFPQPGGNPAPECTAPQLQVYDLKDWQAVARAFVLYSTARAALLDLSQHCRELVVTRLAEAESRWHTLATQGYVQYPWELWLSRALSHNYRNYDRCFAADPSCTGDEGLDPETLRPIFLHPGVGLGFPGFGKRDGEPRAKGELVIAVEAIGVNAYLEDFKHYFGISALVGFQQADFARPRLGVLLHLSRYLELGYLRGFVSETAHNGTIYISVDVLGWSTRSLGWLTVGPALSRDSGL
jgi:hypothetical protein